MSMGKLNKKKIFLHEIDSTNNYANQLILSNAAEEGTVVMTSFQNNGKGQAKNSWESEVGKNLLASIILFPKFLHSGKQFLLSKAISLSIVEFLKSEISGVLIKWPNDIYAGNKKIAGILIENSVKGANLFTSVIGFGINLNQEKFLSEAPNPVSLKQLTGKDFNIEKVLTEIIELFGEWYRILKTGDSSEVDSAYFTQLYRKEEWSTYSCKGQLFEGKIVGIGRFGQLQLELVSGEIKEYMFKEVEFVI